MTLIEISEREVLAAARVWKAWRIATEAGGSVAQPEIDLCSAVILLEERERMVAEMPPVAEIGDRDDAVESSNVSPLGDKVKFPTSAEDQTEWEVPGIGKFPANMEVVACDKCGLEHRRDFICKPIDHRPRKLSRREQEIEKRRRSDPTGRDREDIDYSSDELPSVR